MRVFGARYPVSFACFVLALGLWTASGAAAQGAPCPGGRFVTGFQLQVSAPGRSAAIPFTQINNLDQGDVLHYAPQALPPEWRKSARVAALLVPAAYSASAHLAVFTGRADRTASWKVPEQTAAIAFLFGPKGLNANNTRRMLDQHPELVAHFITYAEQASRVEALVALLARYENSPPGTLDLNTLLKQYSREYGVAMPKANPALPPDQEAAVMLAAVAPPTAEPGPSKHADLTAGSTSTATALATLYYGPVMGLASDAMPLFRALHKTMFPGMQFQGAFAQPDAGGARLCGANTAPPPNKHTVYIWMANLPTGTAPSVRLAKATTATLAAGTNARLQVTCASVAQLRDLMRARQWELVPVKGKPVSIKVQVAPGALNDTLTLDLTHDSHLTGDYYLAAMWDWTPVNVAGTIAVQAPTGLQGATLAPGDAARLIAEGGVVTVTVAGANFSLVNKVELAGASEPFALADGGKQLHVTIDTAQLAAGVHQLRLEQAAGSARELALTVLPPNPRVDAFRANVDEGSQRVMLHGKHLERMARLASADADITLARLPASIPANGLDQRPAIVHLTASAQPGQVLSAKVYVAGSADPLALAHAINVLGPRPRISAVDQSVNAGETVALKPKELPADATVNFAFTIEHAPPVTEVHLRCQSPNDQIQPLTLHAGDTSGTAELESSGNGRYYLAAVAGKIGAPGCDLQMIVPDASAGNSNAYLLGRVVLLPRIHSLTLSDQSAAPGEFAGTLSGDNLQLIAKTGWNASTGIPVTSVPMRVNPSSAAQTLAIAMPWPPPSPHAPLYIWLRGESRGRATTVTQ